MYYRYALGEPKVTQVPTTVATTTTTVPPATPPPKPPRYHYPYYFEYPFQVPYYPGPIAARNTEASPPTPPPVSPQKWDVDAHYQFGRFYPPSFYNYPYGPFYYMKPPPAPTPTSTPAPTSTTTPAPTSTTTFVPYPPDGLNYPETALPSLQCFMGWMVAYLPFADPDSIQVKGQCF